MAERPPSEVIIRPLAPHVCVWRAQSGAAAVMPASLLCCSVGVGVRRAGLERRLVVAAGLSAPCTV